MEKINLELQANTKEAQKNVDDLNKKVKDTGRSARKAGKDLSAGMQIGNEAVRALDRYTGGLASKLVAVGKAAKLSGKAMKTALISTGIGALVVALGLVVQYWDEIGEALGFINKDLEKQKALNDELLTSIDSQLSLLQKEQKYNEQRGISNSENLEKQKQILLAKDAILKRSIKILETQLLQEQAAAKEVTTWDKINAGFQGFLFGYSKQAEILAKTAGVSTEEQKKLNNLQGELNKLKSDELDLDLLLNPPAEKKKEKLKEKVETDPAIEEKAKTIEEIAKLEDAYAQKQLTRQEQELNAVSEKYFALIEKAKQFNLDTAELEENRKAEEDAINQKYDDEKKEKEKADLDYWANESEKRLKKDKEISDAAIKIAEEEFKAKQTSLNGYAGALQTIGGVLGEETAAGKSLAIASSLINTYASITGTLKAFSGVPVPGYAIAQAIATGVAGFAQIKKIASVKVPSGRGGSASVPSGGGSAPATESIPPAFNVVGASGTNQLADAIGGQTQQPTKAYVVANDVTSAQSMQRAIIEGASIG